MRDILMRVVPAKWHLKNDRSFSPYNAALEDLVKRYEKIEKQINRERKVDHNADVERGEAEEASESTPAKNKDFQNKNKNKKKKKKKKKKKVKCDYCGKLGHTEAECRTKAYHKKNLQDKGKNKNCEMSAAICKMVKRKLKSLRANAICTIRAKIPW